MAGTVTHRGCAAISCCGHHYLVYFSKEQAPQSLLWVQRWHDDPELKMCVNCVQQMQGYIVELERQMPE